jgi:hypothetical protein
MKAILLTLRCIIGWPLGAYLILYPIGLLPKMLAQGSTGDYAGLAGTIVASLMLATLGYFIFRDASRVWRRLRSVSGKL